MKFVGYDIEKSYNELLSIQSLDPKIFNEWKDSKKWEIVNYHYKNNTLYNKKNIDSLPNKWQDLPIMEKTDFQSDLDKIVSRTYKLSNLYIANTSGSSGHPFFFANSRK